MLVSPLDKRIKEMSIDWLSALPDSLIIHILSFLEMRRAAVTAVLSKRWQFLWTELPRLLFQESSKDSEKVRKFVARVNRTLMNCSRNNLEKFKVDFQYDECLACDVNAWVEFAVKNKVKNVSLLLNSDEHFHRLSQILYSGSSLRKLSLRDCEMLPRRTIEWPSLTKLKLEYVMLDQNVIEKLVSGCPVLRCLILSNCQGFDCLKVLGSSPGLNELEVRDIGDADDPLMVISAPFAHTLDIRLSPRGRMLQLINFASVVRARFDVNDTYWDAISEELVMTSFKQLFENILHVKELELGYDGTNFLSTLVVKGWQLPQSRRRCLSILASYIEQSVAGIISLLESSPNLEKLVIEGIDNHGDPVTLGPAIKGDLDCNLLHLKTVHIIDFVGEPMLKLAEILLKRAIVLEKMVIGFENVTFPSRNLSKITQTLLSYPRSSQDVASIAIYDRATPKALICCCKVNISGLFSPMNCLPRYNFSL